MPVHILLFNIADSHRFSLVINFLNFFGNQFLAFPYFFFKYLFIMFGLFLAAFNKGINKG